MITAKDLHWKTRNTAANDLMCGRIHLASVSVVGMMEYVVIFTGINIKKYFDSRESAMQSAVTESIIFLNYKE